jgi:eukaryotic-like serine/threonine-protein kinase
MGKQTLLKSRPLTLRVPIATEEERAQFQRRLAMTGLIVFALAFGFFVVTLASVSVVAPGHAKYLFTEASSQIHLTTAFVSLAVWVSIRRGRPSVVILSTLDFVMGVGICIGWAAMMIAGIPLHQRPEMIALLAVSFTLVVRAALIPSTPARTAVIGVCAVLPLVIMTTSLYAGVKRPDDQWGLPPVVDCAIWGALGVSATTVISYVIYGLRQQVRKAMQLGQYVLEEKIGEGGMGVVYRASHAMLRRPTAIKLLSGTASHAAERFEKEVQITARLTHPNTVAVFDYGRTPDGVFYYAMELLDGISLEDLVTQYGPQPAKRVAHLLLQMCGALKEAHAAGLVHRDIKPANVMLTERGGVQDVVKVLDFGLVMESEEAKSAAASSGADADAKNTIMGTPHYMAPEAITDPAGVDSRVDLYAIGCTAYFLLTGENVFEGTNLVEICSAHLHDKPRTPSTRNKDVATAFDKIVLACLEKKPSDRPKDAATLAAMIREANLGDWSVDDAQSWWQSHRKSTAKNKVAAKKPQTPQDGGGGGKKTGTVSVFGNTIAIALDDRRAS